MSLAIHAVFDVAELAASVALSVTDSGGTDASAVVISSGQFAHVDLSGMTAVGASIGSFADLASEIASQLNASATLAETYTVTFDASTLLYSISATGTFSIALPNATTQDVLGVTSAKSGASAYTSDQRVFYSIDGDEGGKSKASDEYRSRDVVKEHLSDDASTFAIRPSVRSVLEDWEIHYEPHAKVFSRLASSAYPWTWEDFFEHCWSRWPFLVQDNGTNKVHTLRAEGASFNDDVRRRVDPDRDWTWHLKFMTRVRGRL